MQNNDQMLTEMEIQSLRWLVFIIKASLKIISQKKLEQILEQIIKLSVTKRHTTLQERTEIIRQTTKILDQVFIKEKESYEENL
tara:strand:- start:4904 stop:5155 length:252 start_codon:yes stop_codon:yes gene_type:complete